MTQEFYFTPGQRMFGRLRDISDEGTLLQTFPKDPPRDPDIPRVYGANPFDQVLDRIIGVEKTADARL